MTFERSTDYGLLNSLLRNPKLYPFLGDDFAPALDDLEATEHPDLWYILGRDEAGILGFWVFAPQSLICWELHTVMPLNGRALAAMRELLGPGGWLWANTRCLRAVTNVPACNRIADRFGRRAGLIPYGRNPKSYLKNGLLDDQILMGVSKPKGSVLCQSSV